MRRTECCRLYKQNLLCGLACTVTTAGVTVLVLLLTHVITITTDPTN